MDISRQLTDYAVEYGVLREEMPRVVHLTAANKKLSKENAKMSKELDVSMKNLFFFSFISGLEYKNIVT